jgi:hypothetical protein
LKIGVGEAGRSSDSVNAVLCKPQKIGASGFEVREIDDHVDLGIEKCLAVGGDLKWTIATGDLAHIEACVMWVDCSNKLQRRIAIDRTAHRASHPSTSTEDSNAQRHGVKLAAGEAFECSRSFT